jgi:hypothetical protein
MNIRTTKGGKMFNKHFRFVVIHAVALVLVFSLFPGQATHAQEIQRTKPEIASLVPGVLGWQQVNPNGFGNSTFPSALSMAVFNNQLYAGASHWGGMGASIWRTANGSNWFPVMTGGFGIPANNPAVIGLIAFKGNLYAGTGWGGATSSRYWRNRCVYCVWRPTVLWDMSRRRCGYANLAQQQR